MRRPATLAVATLAALLLAACGGGEEGGSPSGPASGGKAPGSPPASGQAPQKQQAADPKVRERNAEVRREYRQRQQAAAPTEAEREAEQAASGFYEILGSDEGGKSRTTIDSAAFCELMSEAAREETVAYARRASGEAKDWDCEQAIELLVLRAKQTGAFKQVRQAEVVGVNAEGDRATASVRFGEGPIASVPLVREDGEWKLANSLAGKRGQ